MNCEQAKEGMMQRLAEGLAEDLRMDLDAHLTGCTACREEHRLLEVLWKGLGDFPESKLGIL